MRQIDGEISYDDLLDALIRMSYGEDFGEQLEATARAASWTGEVRRPVV